MITGTKVSEKQTKQGFDIGVEFIDSETKNKSHTTYSFVSQREILHDLNNRITRTCLSIEAQIADDKIKKEWSREELEVLLKGKNLITDGLTVEVLIVVVVEELVK